MLVRRARVVARAIGERFADGRQLVERAGVAPADQLAARPLLERPRTGPRAPASASPCRPEARSPCRTRTYVSSGPTAAATFAVSVHGVVVQTSSDSPGRSTSGKRTVEPGVLAVLVALVHLVLADAGPAARAPRHRVVALVDPAALVALGEEAPDQVVVLVAEGEVASPRRSGMPEPPDQHLDRVRHRSVRALDGRRPAPDRRPAGRAAGAARPGRSSPSTSRGGWTARSGARRRSGRAACTGLTNSAMPYASMSRLLVKPRSRSTLTSTHRPWQSNPFCQRWSSPSMAWKRWNRSLYVRPQAWCTPIGLLAVIGPSRKLQRGPPAFWARRRAKVARSRQRLEDLVLQGDEIGLRGERVGTSGLGWVVPAGRRRPEPEGLGLPPAAVRLSYPRCRRPQETRPRGRSPFAAAFLSLLFPGLGHAYARRVPRGLGFAAPPLCSSP